MWIKGGMAGNMLGAGRWALGAAGAATLPGVQSPPKARFGPVAGTHRPQTRAGRARRALAGRCQLTRCRCLPGVQSPPKARFGPVAGACWRGYLARFLPTTVKNSRAAWRRGRGACVLTCIFYGHIKRREDEEKKEIDSERKTMQAVRQDIQVLAKLVIVLRHTVS